MTVGVYSAMSWLQQQHDAYFYSMRWTLSDALGMLRRFFREASLALGPRVSQHILALGVFLHV